MSTLTSSHAAPFAASEPFAEQLVAAGTEGVASAGATLVASGGGGSSRVMAMPHLLGAPAYARPPRIAAETPRPLDPDDLPIAAMRNPEDEALLMMADQPAVGDPKPTLRPSSQGGLRAVASRLFGSGA